jgi:hypothetical protein
MAPCHKPRAPATDTAVADKGVYAIRYTITAAKIVKSVQWLRYRSDDRDPTPGRVSYFSLSQNIQAGSGAHPASYPMDIMNSFLGLKRPGREAVNPPPSSADVKNACNKTSWSSG